MTRVPDDLADAILRAATTIPSHGGGDLDELRRRHRVRRRHRAVWATGAAAVMVGLAVGAVPLLVRADQPVHVERLTTAGPDDSSAPQVAQRLLLPAVGWTQRPSGGGPTVGVMGLPGLGEVRADGSIAMWQVPGIDGWSEAIPLVDGRIVVLGYRKQSSATTPVDGPGVPGRSVVIEVLTADGAVERAREVRQDGQHIALLAATTATAYLLRASGLVAYDLTTGKETPVLSAATLGTPASPVELLDIGASLIALLHTGSSQSCALRIFDLSSGARRSDTPLAGLRCGYPEGVALSPDGTLAAIAYRSTAGGGSPSQPQVAVVDVASGTVRVDRPLGTVSDAGGYRIRVYGMAWSDPGALRVAWAELPAGADRVYRLDEVLRVESLRM